MRASRPALAPTAALLFALLAPLPALASADIDCTPDLRLAHAIYTRCDLMSVLSPGNDTRANLLLLLLDRDGEPPRSPPAPPLPSDAVPLLFWSDFREHFVGPTPKDAAGFARGEGSRCRSAATGAAAFKAAVAAAGDVPAGEKATLVADRDALMPDCAEGAQHADGRPSPLQTAEPIRSATGQAFAAYVDGAAAFYAGRFDEALADFDKARGSSDAWLADTADYMTARSLVNKLQIGAFDDYGDSVKPRSGPEADHVLAALEAYLRGHPRGAYAASARGLKRRVDWVAGRKDALAASYPALLARPLAERGIDDAALSEEIADKLLPGLDPATTHDPILLAAYDLAALREPDRTDNAEAPPPKRPDIVAQVADFAGAMPLYEFLLAAQAFYIDHDPAAVMKLLPDDTRRRGGDHVWFSRQVLRGLALEARGDRNARGFWKELYSATSRPLEQLTVQLGLALHDERARTIADALAPGSIVGSQTIRAILIENDADAALLRHIARDDAATEPDGSLALSTLLWKEVTRGHAADFLADLRAADGRAAADVFRKPFPGEIDCPLLATTAAQLAADARAARARLCLSEFVRLSDVRFDGKPDPFDIYSSQPKGDDLGGAPSMFPGKPYDRASTYQAIIADRAAPAADRAYALYRAVMCWAPSGVNDCGGPDVPKARREAWYRELKRAYPASRFARELAYWW